MPLSISKLSSTRAAGAALVALVAAAGARAAPLPSVASINLCADQLVLSVAAPEQVLTVSWLSADTQESLLAAQAARYPLNYGSAEELLRFHPDVVMAGAYTNAFTRALLARLGYQVIELEPEDSVADIERNLAASSPRRSAEKSVATRSSRRSMSASSRSRARGPPTRPRPSS